MVVRPLVIRAIQELAAEESKEALHPVAQFYSSTGLSPYLEALGSADSAILLDRSFASVVYILIIREFLALKLFR